MRKGLNLPLEFFEQNFDVNVKDAAVLRIKQSNLVDQYGIQRLVFSDIDPWKFLKDQDELVDLLFTLFQSNFIRLWFIRNTLINSHFLLR